MVYLDVTTCETSVIFVFSCSVFFVLLFYVFHTFLLGQKTFISRPHNLHTVLLSSPFFSFFSGKEGHQELKEYMKDVFHEMKDLECTGLDFNGRHFNIEW